MRQVDKLGRIVIPLELREKYGLTAGAEVEFSESCDGVTVKAAVPFCKLCRSEISLEAKFPLCQACIKLIKAYDGER
jgi:AbrB family looped-hinge helix DNA binding protein